MYLIFFRLLKKIICKQIHNENTFQPYSAFYTSDYENKS